MNEEDKARIDSKIDTLKQKRAGTILKMEVAVSKDRNINLANCINEMQKLAELHQLTYDELNIVRGQLQWVATCAVMDLKIQRYNIQLQNSITKVEKEAKEPDNSPVPEVKYDDEIKPEVIDQKEEDKREAAK